MEYKWAAYGSPIIFSYTKENSRTMSYTSRHKGSVIDDAVDKAHNPAEVEQGNGIIVSKSTDSGTDTFTVSVDGTVAKKSDLPSVPTKVSQLTNDSGYQTSSDVSSAVAGAIGSLDVAQVGGNGKYIQSISEDNGKISATAATMPSVPTKTSDLVNDSGFLTEHQSLTAYAKKTELPTKTSDLTNDSGFLTEHQSLNDYAKTSYVDSTLSQKQDRLVAGANITIAADGKTISAKDTTYKAGANISISDDGYISASGELSSTEWGNIAGNLSSQADLKEALDSKATPQDITDAIDALDVVDSSTLNQYLQYIYQKNGKIEPHHAFINERLGTGLTWNISTNKVDVTTVVPTKTSDLTNDSGFITEHQSLADYTKKTYVDAEVAKKQDTLTAGDNIQIADDGTISATDTTYTANTNYGVSISSSNDISLSGKASWVLNVPSDIKDQMQDLPDSTMFMRGYSTISSVDENDKPSSYQAMQLFLTSWIHNMSTAGANEDSGIITGRAFKDWIGLVGPFQKKLIAGSGITIAADGRTISATGGGGGDATWGSITGTLSNQTDLKSALDAKQDNLTAGSGISIATDGKTISASVSFGDITGDPADNTLMAEAFQNVEEALADKADVFTVNDDVLTFDDGVIDLTQEVKEAFYAAQLTHIVKAGSGITVTEELPPSSEFPTYTISATGGGSSYDPGNRVVITDASQFSSLAAGTCYEINKDFSLTGTYTIPANVTFYFKGGSISGGTFKCPGDKTATIDGVSSSWYSDQKKRPLLLGDVCFNKLNYDMSWDGGFANDEVHTDWYNTVTSHTNSNADIINALIRNCHRQTIVVDKMLPITKSIKVVANEQVTLRGKDVFQGGYATFTGSCNSGFYIVGKLFSAIIQTGGSLNLVSITCLGAKTAYGVVNPRYDGSYFDNTLVDPYGVTYTLNSGVSGSELVNSSNFCGFDCRGGNCELIEDCCFNGFCRGISLDASKTWASCAPGFISRCFISTCKYGLYVNRVSDFFCTDCKFNSCVSDVPLSNSTYSVDRNNIKSQFKTSAAVYLTGSAMIQFTGCRWEFNYIGLYIDSSCFNVSVTGSIFDRHTHSILAVNNDTYIGPSGAGEVFPDRRNPAISLNFTGNNIVRGLGRRTNWGGTSYSFLPGVAYYSFHSVKDGTSDTKIKDADGLRRCIVNISGNTVCDTEELNPGATSDADGGYDPSRYEYEHALFFFDCGNGDLGGVKIVHTGNDYNGSAATHFCESSTTTSSTGYALVKGSGNLYNSSINFTAPYKYNSGSYSSKCCKCYEGSVEDDQVYSIDTYNGQGKHVISTGGGSSDRSIKVLFFGNSFTKNSVSYLPYLLDNLDPSLDYRIAIASISGAPLAQHYANLYNQSVTVGGTTYAPESYNYWEISSTSSKWTGGDPSTAHQTWQDAAVTKSVSAILADGPWDIVCFQQGGQTAASNWNTYYAPFIYGIHSKVSEMAAANDYTTKFAWNLTHGAYQATHANQKTAWQGTATNSEYVMERTGTSLLFPYGTAVQNLRTTSLDAAGVGGDGIGLLAGDTTHLHEGIAKYAAAMAIALPLLRDSGIIANPVSDDFRITKALTETYNVPYPNYGTSGTVKGIDDSKCFIAQMAAIAAVNNPYSESDMSGYEGNTQQTYTVKNYLESGGSYIDLGVKVLDEKWDVESKFRLKNTTTQVWLYWYRGNSGNYEQVSQILYTSGDGAPRWPICSRSSATNGTRPQVTSMNASTDYTVSTSGTHAYLNGTQLSNTMVEEEMYKPDHNFELFSKIHTNADGTSTAREVSPNIRVYNFKLKHSDGTVAIDLVPAMRDSDSAVGMLDQSTNTFYPCVGGSPTVG